MTTISKYIEVEVDVEMDDFDDDELIVEVKGRGYKVLEKSDYYIPCDEAAVNDSIVERAFLIARRMDNLPSEIKELFYRVHNRAIP